MRPSAFEAENYGRTNACHSTTKAGPSLTLLVYAALRRIIGYNSGVLKGQHVPALQQLTGQLYTGLYEGLMQNQKVFLACS